LIVSHGDTMTLARILRFPVEIPGFPRNRELGINAYRLDIAAHSAAPAPEKA
jgi:hypothetical protein